MNDNIIKVPIPAQHVVLDIMSQLPRNVVVRIVGVFVLLAAQVVPVMAAVHLADMVSLPWLHVVIAIMVSLLALAASCGMPVLGMAINGHYDAICDAVSSATGLPFSVVVDLLRDGGREMLFGELYWRACRHDDIVDMMWRRIDVQQSHKM